MTITLGRREYYKNITTIFCTDQQIGVHTFKGVHQFIDPYMISKSNVTQFKQMPNEIIKDNNTKHEENDLAFE